MIIRSIKLLPAQEHPTYESYLAAQPQVTMSQEAQEWSMTVQGEHAGTRSSPSLYFPYFLF
jgi:hypothetical protein